VALDRLEFWTRMVVSGLFLVLISLFGFVLMEVGFILIVFSWFAVPVMQFVWARRRFHDIGLSGAWLLLHLVPFFGNITVMILLLLPTDSFRQYNKRPLGRLR